MQGGFVRASVQGGIGGTIAQVCCGHVAKWRLPQPTEWRFVDLCSATPAHEPHLLSVKRKPYNYDGCFACANGCPTFLLSTLSLERFGRGGIRPLGSLGWRGFFS